MALKAPIIIAQGATLGSMGISTIYALKERVNETLFQSVSQMMAWVPRVAP